ncbi:MAG: GntR family transcriptional regulator [Alphaproteobacteria bacterium]|nr:GntR family transcriptional regulator [Alphaproteobacteria bacterium]
MDIMRATLNVVLPDAPDSLWQGTPRLHDLAYAYLKGLLLGGGLDPGDQISSEGVGRVLSMSRAPVSDAIRRLTVEGLLEILPQVGCRVVRPLPAEVRDLYEIFGASEGVIARWAAERRSEPEAGEFRALCASLASGAGLPSDPDARFLELRRRNRRRYEMLHRLARSPLSTDSGETYWDRSDFFLRVTFGGRDLPGFVRGARAALVEAVVAGDGQSAEHETRRYLVRLGREVADALERQAREQSRR